MVILCFLLVGFEEGTRCGGASWGAKIILFRAVVKGVRGDASQYMDNTAGGIVRGDASQYMDNTAGGIVRG